MEMVIHDGKKTVEIWLTNAEKKDAELRAGLKELYGKYYKQHYLVAVFESGEKDLYQGTLDLLVYNRRRSARLEVQREKQQRAAATER